MDNKKAKKSTKGANGKKGSNLLRILILVVVLSLVAIGGIIVSDVFFSENSSSPEIETVTVTVSGSEILLNGSKKVALDELDSYFTERFKSGDYCTIALINDTQTPADIETYNEVVSMLSKFGIENEPLTLAATNDEQKTTVDEAA